jgi:hypothetical protein
MHFRGSRSTGISIRFPFRSTVSQPLVPLTGCRTDHTTSPRRLERSDGFGERYRCICHRRARATSEVTFASKAGPRAYRHHP